MNVGYDDIVHIDGAGKATIEGGTIDLNIEGVPQNKWILPRIWDAICKRPIARPLWITNCVFTGPSDTPSIVTGPVNAKNAVEQFGETPGTVIHFTFYADKHDGSLITPDDAYGLQWRLISWLRGKEYGFDGGAHLFSTWQEEDDYHKESAHG